jgi:hypothetical protein
MNKIIYELTSFLAEAFIKKHQNILYLNIIRSKKGQFVEAFNKYLNGWVIYKS